MTHLLARVAGDGPDDGLGSPGNIVVGTLKSGSVLVSHFG